MDLSSIFQAVLDFKSDDAATAVAPLKAGDRLAGRVLRIEADGRVLIDLGRFRAKAQIGFPVKVGQALKLKVVQSGNPLHLQADVKTPPLARLDVPILDFSQVFAASDQNMLVSLVERMANIPNVHWATVPFSSSIREAMSQIKGIFDPIPIDRTTEQLANWLKGALEDRGVLFEKKMADVIEANIVRSEGSKSAETSHVSSVIARDLKPQLIMLKAFFEGEGALEIMGGRIGEEDLDFVRQRVSKLLEHVVQQQERVVRNAREGEMFQIFTHMLSIDEQKLPVQFKVFYPKRGDRDKSDPHHHIALLLMMDRLGPVRVDLTMADRHLNVRFFVSDAAVQGQFERNSEALGNILEGFFDEVVLTTRISEEKIKQFDQHQQDESPLGRIDIKA